MNGARTIFIGQRLFFTLLLVMLGLVSACGTTTGNALSGGQSQITIEAGIGSQADTFALVSMGQMTASLVQPTLSSAALLRRRLPPLQALPTFGPSIKVCATSLQLSYTAGALPEVTNVNLPPAQAAIGLTAATLGTVAVASLTYQGAKLVLAPHCGNVPSLDFSDDGTHKHASSEKTITLTFNGTFDFSQGDGYLYLDFSAVGLALENLGTGDDPGDAASKAVGEGKGHLKHNGND